MITSCYTFTLIACFNCLVRFCMCSIAQFSIYYIQLQTIDFSMRLRGINFRVCGFSLPRSLVVMSVVLSGILKYRNWPIVKLNHMTGSIQFELHFDQAFSPLPSPSPRGFNIFESVRCMMPKLLTAEPCWSVTQLLELDQ